MLTTVTPMDPAQPPTPDRRYTWAVLGIDGDTEVICRVGVTVDRETAKTRLADALLEAPDEAYGTIRSHAVNVPVTRDTITQLVALAARNLTTGDIDWDGPDASGGPVPETPVV
jgi:hypothetical protein